MIDLEIAVVMPDHVHLIFWPRRNGSGLSYSIPEIMKSIKGASAHKVNGLLRRKGQLWQTEFFDHVIRKDDNLQEKINYIRLNPVRRGLVERPEDYEWLWERSFPVLYQRGRGRPRPQTQFLAAFEFSAYSNTPRPDLRPRRPALTYWINSGEGLNFSPRVRWRYSRM